jgi:hypothetical protein
MELQESRYYFINCLLKAATNFINCYLISARNYQPLFRKPFYMGISTFQKLFYDCTSSFLNPYGNKN